MEDTGTCPLRSNGYELFIPISMPEREVDVNAANPQPISDLKADLEADGAACYTVGNGPVVFVKGAGL
jgi:hypothetical protein